MKTLVCSLFLIITTRLFAPADDRVMLFVPEPINPFERLINAVVTVESDSNNFAYNPIEEARGAFQIRPIRLLDYNQRNGSNYTLKDCYNYEISKRIFLFYAAQIGPYDFEKIAKAWNGSGELTEFYWLKVQSCLFNN